MWHRSSLPCVENSTLKSSSWRERAVHPEARRVERHGLGRVVVGAHDLGVASAAAAADVVALEHGDVADAVVLGEVERERQPVHAAAHDHHVVARLQLARCRNSAMRSSPSRREHLRGVGPDAFLEVVAEHRGHEDRERRRLDEHLGGGVRHLALDPAALRGGSSSESRANASRASSPVEHERRPAVGDVVDQRRWARASAVADASDVDGHRPAASRRERPAARGRARRDPRPDRRRSAEASTTITDGEFRSAAQPRSRTPSGS